MLETQDVSQQSEFATPSGSHRVMVPVSALRLFVEVLTHISAGNAVNILPIRAELTTQEAADLLNVSRPFLIRLLENHEIPFHKTGSHRRVRYQDAVDYKNRIDAARRKNLDELAEQAQELRLAWPP